MPILVNKDWCKKCQICMELCPKELIAMDEDGFAVLKEPEQCNECAICSWVCPDFAIEIIEK